MVIKLDTDVLLLTTVLVISIVFLVSGLSWRKLIKTDQNKKKLVITARVKRLIFTITLLYLIPVVFIGLKLDDVKNIWTMILVLNIMTYLNSFVVFIAMLINMPVEKLVYLHYKTKAQRKLKSMSNLKISSFNLEYEDSS